MLAADRVREVFQYLDVAGRFHLVLIARDRHEIDSKLQVYDPHQIGEEDARALKNAHQHQVLVRVITGDLLAELANAGLYLLFGIKHLKIWVCKL